MSLRNPPYYRYSLFSVWDRKAFKMLKKIGKRKPVPRLSGDREARDKFLTMLIRTQKSVHGWRRFLKAVLGQIERTDAVDMPALVKKYPLSSIKKGKVAWATYKEDRIVSDFIDRLGRIKLHFVGTPEQASEFILRFILGQLGHDWEQTIFMIYELLGKGRKLSLGRLNKEMRKFDYEKVFKF